MSQFVVNKDQFINNFLQPLSVFDLADKCALVTLKDDNLVGITHAEDRSSISQITLKGVQGDVTSPFILRDIPRLLNALRFVEEPTITLHVEADHLKYDQGGIRFKSYFLNNQFFDDKVEVKIGKIRGLEFPTHVNIPKDSLKKLKQSSQFANKTDKVYLRGDGTNVIASRKDNVQSKIDTIEFSISTTDTEFAEIPLYMSIFDIMTDKKENLVMNLNSDMGIFLFVDETETYKQEYITSASRK